MNRIFSLAMLLIIVSLLGVVQLGFGQQSKVLVVAVSKEPDVTDFNPAKALVNYWLSEPYPGLVGWDQVGSVVPALAQSWTISPDGLTVQFVLKDGLKWSDGQPITSEDVAFTFKAMAEQSVFYYSQWAPIETPSSGVATGYTVKPGAITTSDARTTVFHLAAPSATFFIYTGMWTIIPKHSYQGIDLSKQNPDLSTMVASGPFIPRERIPGDKIVYVANPNYYGGAPYLDQVIFKLYKDATSAEIGLQSGEAGFMLDVPPTDVSALSKIPSLQVGTEPSQYVTFLIFNLRPKLVDGSTNPVADLRVRQAIAMSLNLPQILNASLHGYSKLANQLVVPNMYYLGKSVSNTSIPSPAYPYQPDTARALLDKAGYPAGAGGTRFSMNIIIPTQGWAADPSGLQIMQLIQTSLRAVGINLDLIVMERSSGRARIYRAQPPKDWNLAAGQNAQAPDPDIPAFFVVSSLGDNAKAGGFNAGGYDNSILNHLVLLGENTTDVDARIAIYQRIWGIVYQDLPILPIYYRTEIHAWNKMYTGFVLGIGNPINDGWGILKSQSLALVKIAVQSTTTTGPTTPVTDYTMLAVIVVVVIIVASLAYFAGRRGKRSA